MSDAVISTIVPGHLIQDYINQKLLPIVTGERLDVVAASMLTVIFTNMMPDITAEQLAEAVQGTAAYMVTVLSGLDGKASVN